MKIYIVKGECGQWSDHSEWNVCAYTTEEKAARLVFDLETLQRYNDHFCKREYAEFDVAYIASGIDQIDPSPIHPEVPEDWRLLNEFCSNGRGTPEHKSSFRQLQKLHLANIETYKKAYQEWNKLNHARADRMLEARKIWFQENYNPVGLEHAVKYIQTNYGGYRRFNTDCKYFYREVELVE